MSVKAVCTGCGKSFNAPDQYAGKKVKCKACGAAFRVPGPAAEAPRAATAKPATAAAAPRTAPMAAAATARKTKPVAAPVAADDDQGEYGLSGGGGDDWSALEAAAPAPSYNPSAGAPAAAPAYKPAAAGASRGTKFMPSTAQPMSARKNAVAAGQGMHPLMMVQIGAFALPVLLLVLGKIIPVLATPGILLATLVAMVFMFWGQIGILMTAAHEGGVCVILYLFVPFYPLYFILTRFDEVSHHVIRTVAGIALMFGAIMMIMSQQP